MSSRVSLHHSDNRQANIASVLGALGDDLIQKIKAGKHILIKPNLVHDTNPLAIVPGESVGTVIEFIRQHSAAPIVVGDASFHGTERAFDNFGYRDLPKQFPNVTLLDFNAGPTVAGTLYHTGMKEHAIRIARAVVEADFRICLSPMKTHNHFITTLSIKNWAVGIMVVPGRLGLWQRWPHFHAQGYRVSHKSVVRVAKDFPMQFAIVDGWEGMEGNGPTHGSAVPMHLSIAGFDPVAVDATAARLMGFDPHNIGYLVFGQEEGLGTWEEKSIALTGNGTIDELMKKFTPHSTYSRQLQWKRENERGSGFRSLVSQVLRR